jgi:glutathione S-transferase
MADLRLVGSSVSPYTRKVRALLRYRRIPYHFVRAGGRESEALPPAPLPLIPYVILPDQNGASRTTTRSALCGQWTRHWP